MRKDRHTRRKDSFFYGKKKIEKFTQQRKISFKEALRTYLFPYLGDISDDRFHTFGAVDGSNLFWNRILNLQEKISKLTDDEKDNQWLS